VIAKRGEELRPLNAKGPKATRGAAVIKFLQLWLWFGADNYPLISSNIINALGYDNWNLSE
jgi:hypothetical protein